jgi:hypothetical protein
VAIAAARLAAGHEGHDVSSSGGGDDGDDGAVAAEGAVPLGAELSAMVDSIAIVEELLAQQQAQRLAAARDEDGDDEEEEEEEAAAEGAEVAGRTAAPARPSPIPAPLSPAAPLPRAPPPLFGGDEEEDDDDDDDDDTKQPVAALPSATPGSSSRGEGADVSAALAALLGTTDGAGGDGSRMDGEDELGDLI